MVTQLQDVYNQVAQQKIGNQRLRNEELRRQLRQPWSEPVEEKQSATGIQPVQDVTKGTTVADAYSSLLNNWNALNNAGNTSRGPVANSYDGSNKSYSIPSWASPMVSTGMQFAGAPTPVSLFGSVAMDAAAGRKESAVGSLTNYATNQFTKGIPGIGGFAGTLASGLMGDKSSADIGKGLFNSGLGSLFAAANPMSGVAYGLARMFGFDPARGFQNMLSPDKTNPESWRGGFWSGGYTPEAGSWMSSGNENYSPYGGDSYSRVSDNNNYSNWSSGQAYSTPDSYSSYSSDSSDSGSDSGGDSSSSSGGD